MIVDDEKPQSHTPGQARERLTAQGMAFSEEHFLRHVRSGNLSTVALYLSAGMSPNTRLDGETALSASVNAGHIDVTRLLLESGADPIGLTEGLKLKQDRKDLWERLSSMSGVFTFTSSLVVAAVGWYFTNAYNGRQLDLTAQQSRRDQENKDYQNRLAEMQTVEKMIPHLTKDEASKRAALIAIDALASRSLAVKIAEAYGGQGSIDALAQMASSAKNTPGAPAVAALTNLANREQSSALRPAQDALAQVLEGRKKAIVKIFIGNGALCNGFVVDGSRGWIATPRYCVSDPVASSLSIQFADGSRAPVRKTVFSPDGLIALLNTGKSGLPDIQLSKMKLSSGSSVTQLAFNFARNQVAVILGQVVEAGPMAFGAASPTHTASVLGLKVNLATSERMGAAGGPLLDGEGNAACMTYQSAPGPGDLEQCIDAAVIAEAMKALPR